MAFAMVLGALLLAGCGGGGGTAGTGGGGGNPDGSLSGSYSGRVEMTDGLYGLVTLTVRDESGAASGAVYVYDENQTRAVTRASRHFGEHPLMASGALAGTVDPATRAMALSGTLTYENRQTRPVEIVGVLRGAGADKGSLGLKVGPDTFTDGTFY